MSREHYHIIRQDCTNAGDSSASTEQVTFQLPTSNSSGALWELVSLDLFATSAGAANTVTQHWFNVAGSAADSKYQIFEEAARNIASGIWMHIDLNDRHPLIFAADANDRVYCLLTFNDTSEDNVLSLTAVFKQLKGSAVVQTTAG